MSEPTGDSGMHPPASPSPEPEPKRPQMPSRLLPGMLMAALVVVAGAVLVSRWAPIANSPAEPPAGTSVATRIENASGATADLQRGLASLNARLQADESRLGSIDKTGGGAPGTNAPGFSDLASRLGGVEARLNALENQIARAADKDVQVSLQERLTKLESASSGEALKRAATVLALATLALAASEAMPFKPQLEAMSALDPGDAAVAALAPYATEGVPTIAVLRARFPFAARAALDAERAQVVGDGLWTRLWTSVARLISVRRVGDVPGATSSDRLARAEADLERNDLTGALSEGGALIGPASAAMAPWLVQAQSRATVDRALADMESRIVQTLGAPAPARQPTVLPRSLAPRNGTTQGARP
jgi:hypothetical protein